MFNNFHSIYRKIIISFFIGTFAVLAIASTLYLTYFSDALNRRLESDQAILMTQVASNIESVIENMSQASSYLFSDTNIASLCNQDASEWNSGSFLFRKNLNDSFRFYMKAPSSLQNFSPLLFLYPEVRISSSMDKVKLEEIKNPENLTLSIFDATNVLDEDWFLQAELGHGRFSIFMFPDNKEVLYFARLIQNNTVDNPIRSGYMGVMVMTVPLQEFQQNLELSLLTENSQIHLVNQENIIVYSNDFSAIGKVITEKISEDNIKSLQKTQHLKTSNYNVECLASSYRLNSGLRLYSFIPYHDITQELDSIKVVSAGILIACVLLSVGISMGVSKGITTPIVRLSHNMQRITENGNSFTKIVLPPPCKDEVGQLYSSFNSLQEYISHLLQLTYENAQKQKRLELTALQAQINPHFVYNTLDSINWVALCNGEKEIACMVSALAFIMRYSISDPDALVTIRQELKHVEQYVVIQSLRYENNFTVSYQVEELTIECMIPKFIIQPLVENAILHGVEQNNGGYIKIGCLPDGEDIIITVEDDGVGADVQGLNTYLWEDSSILPNSDGFGIRNVQERLQLWFGKQYGLSFHSNMSGGVTAMLRFPQIKDTSEIPAVLADLNMETKAPLSF